jgi:anti-sigma regulatory factor (Ser/Thr protein kinase)
MTLGAASSVNTGRREHLTGTYPAVPETVPTLRRALARLAADAGATDEQVAAIRLAVSEALTNVVVHAYADPATPPGSPPRPGPLHVSADVAGSELWVLIADDGGGLRPGSESPGLGVGLALIAAAADDFDVVSRSSGGIEVRMRFGIGPDSADGDQPRGSESSARTPARPVFSTTR